MVLGKCVADGDGGVWSIRDEKLCTWGDGLGTGHYWGAVVGNEIVFSDDETFTVVSDPEELAENEPAKPAVDPRLREFAEWLDAELKAHRDESNEIEGDELERVGYKFADLFPEIGGGT